MLSALCAFTSLRHAPCVMLSMKLLPDEIHVWCVSLDQSASDFQMLLQTLSPDERLRAERFHFEEDRNHFIISRGILRTILGRYLSVEPDKLQFCYGKHGKPALADMSGKGRICFNSSRSDGLALYAFARDREIGIDIEHICDIPEMDQIVERFFSITESKVFHSLPESRKKEAFFNCWTRKEAFIKASGDGLYQPLDKFDVLLKPNEPSKLDGIRGDSKRAFRWSVQDLKPAAGFAAALAVEGQNLRLCCYQWPGWVT